MTLVHPDSPDAWAAARRLVEAYAASLGVDLGFQDFEREMASLTEVYGPPDGCFLLAAEDGGYVGCGALRRFSESACELKRLYVAPEQRGSGAGRRIAQALIARARARGYQAVLLDTLPSMVEAQRMYAALGFAPAPPYRYNPVPGASYWRLDLRQIDQNRPGGER